jgi:plastocyanin
MRASIFPVRRAVVSLLFLICSWLFIEERAIGASGTLPAGLSLSDPENETRVTIEIKNRKFIPETVTLSPDKKTRLIIKNGDAELHAFVPVGLLTNTHLNLSGNGAPHFGKEGLLRVLLPSRGQTDIVFFPSRPGTYPYLCDLPGHTMHGNIVVQVR